MYYMDISWTLVTLKELMDERYKAHDTAITKAESAMDKRFESVNEFRAQLRDQAASFVTRRELDSITESIRKLEAFQASTQGSSSTHSTSRLQNNWWIGLLVTIIIAVSGIIITLLRH